MVFITAEIGINHNGDIQIVKKLIDIAKQAGCDAVKFQKKNYRKSLFQRSFRLSKRKSLGNYYKRTKTWIRIW